MNTQLKQAINDARGATGQLGDIVKHLKAHEALNPLSLSPQAQESIGEAKANIMLAYRHLEDARMRLGKAIQAMEGGVSIFEKPRGKWTVEDRSGEQVLVSPEGGDHFYRVDHPEQLAHLINKV